MATGAMRPRRKTARGSGQATAKTLAKTARGRASATASGPAENQTSELTRHEQELRAAYREVRPQLLLGSLSALLVGLAYAFLPENLTIGPSWLLLAVSAVALAPLIYGALFHPFSHRIAHILRFGLQIALTLSLLASIVLYVTGLPKETKGGTLLRSSVILWASNILIFSGWYWEIDGYGPFGRRKRGHRAADFQFPQQANGGRWAPGFLDYLFLAFCTATALSPADTQPLTQRAKLLTLLESALSLAILVLLVGRSINIIS